MINDEVVNFIKIKLEEGATRAEIEDILITQGGWSKEDVDLAFSVAGYTAPREVPGQYSVGPDLSASTEEATVTVKGSRRFSSRLVLPIAIVVAILVLGSVGYFFAGDLVKKKFVRADSIDGFILAFAEGIQKLDKFTYEVEVSVSQEPRNGKISPINLSEPEYSKETLDAVERDIEKTAELSTIRYALDDHYSKNKRYPSSLTALDFYREVDTGAYSYSSSDNGSTAHLSIALEAPETVAYFSRQRMYEDETAEGGVTVEADFDRSVVTFVFSKGGYGYVYPPYSVESVLSKSAIVQGLESLGLMVRFLPERFKGDMVFSGALGVTEKVPNSENALSANIDWGDMTFKVGAEAILKDEIFYGRINNFPSFPFLNIDAIRGKWIKVTEKDLEKNYMLEGFFDSSPLSPKKNEDSTEDIEKGLKILREAITKHKPLMLKEAPVKEKLGDDRSVIKYNLGLDGKQLADFYEYLYEEIASNFYEGDKAEAFRVQAQGEMRYLRSSAFLDVITYLNKNAEFVVWLDEKNGYPVQHLQKITFVADPDTSEDFFFGSGGSLNSQLVFSTRTTLSNINKSVNIQAPKDAISIDDAELLMSSIVGESLETARTKAQDAKLKSSLSNVWSQAEIYYEDNGSYGGVCSDSVGGVAEFLVSAKESAKDGIVSCFDSVSAWAAEGKLQSGEFYCADSLGGWSNHKTSTISSGDMVCG